jgi:hypothetical protein
LTSTPQTVSASYSAKVIYIVVICAEAPTVNGHLYVDLLFNGGQLEQYLNIFTLVYRVCQEIDGHKRISFHIPTLSLGVHKVSNADFHPERPCNNH